MVTPPPKEKKTFVESLITVCGYCDTCAKSDHAVRMYSCTESMKEQAMQHSDRDYLIVPKDRSPDRHSHDPDGAQLPPSSAEVHPARSPRHCLLTRRHGSVPRLHPRAVQGCSRVTVRYLQLLRELGVMVYSEELTTRVDKSV